MLSVCLHACFDSLALAYSFQAYIQSKMTRLAVQILSLANTNRHAIIQEQ